MYMAQEWYLMLTKTALLRIESHSNLFQFVQYILQRNEMFLKARRIYQYVVQIHQQARKDEVRQDLIHQPLECCWCICQSKRHSVELKVQKGM